MIGIDLPEKVAGLLVLRELEAFSSVITAPQRPLVAIVGGAKISDKIKLVDNLITKSDKIIVCGGMAYTFLKAFFCFSYEIIFLMFLSTEVRPVTFPFSAHIGYSLQLGV